MIDNRKIAEITGVWDETCADCEMATPCDGEIHHKTFGLDTCCFCVGSSPPRIPDFLHDDSAFVKVLDWLMSEYMWDFRLQRLEDCVYCEIYKGEYGGGISSIGKDARTALLLAVQQLGDSDAS